MDTFITLPDVLYGREISEIELLAGQHWGDLYTRQQLLGSCWRFDADGNFRYFPGLDADVRSDLVPLCGTYQRQAISCHVLAERRAVDSEIWSWLEAEILVDDGGYRAQATLGVSSGQTHLKMARFVLSLSPTPSAADRVHGVEVPALFRVMFKGTTSAERFGLPGYCLLRKPSAENAHPISLRLSTELLRVGGALFLDIPHKHEPEAQDELATFHCTLHAGEMPFSFSAVVGGSPLNSFVVSSRGDPLSGFGMPVKIRSGNLDIDVQPSRIRGALNLHGVYRGVYDETDVTLHAEFEGARAAQDDRGWPCGDESRRDQPASDVLGYLAGKWEWAGLGEFELVHISERWYHGSFAWSPLLKGTIRGEADEFGRVTLVFDREDGAWGFVKAQYESGSLAGQYWSRRDDHFAGFASRG